ncbi:site-2 protease family protein [Limnoglobus roseus]|nr:site-2 protease family protein [Limnoglobus roseus]
MSWAVPLYRAFGILVKVHFTFFLITIPMFLRLVYLADGAVWWFDIFMLCVGLVFMLVLLHEYGHCIAARRVGGDASEILLWPLGGLASVENPHTPKANFIVAAGGPAVNLVVCIACAVAFLAAGFSPLQALNPFSHPYQTTAYNYQDGRYYSSNYDYYYYKPGTSEPAGTRTTSDKGVVVTLPGSAEQAERAILPAWLIWAWRTCWLSWWLFLFNVLIPAYPMDGGRMLHAILWHRIDYRSATVTCCYVGYGAAAVLVGIAILTSQTALACLALFIAWNCYRTLTQETESERGAFGYDFSQGYTSLERDDPPPVRRKRKNFVRRWLDARKAKKRQQEQEQVTRDDQRMDDLLDKIAKSGKNSLTDEERRFMERVSARYRNK